MSSGGTRATVLYAGGLADRAFDPTSAIESTGVGIVTAVRTVADALAAFETSSFDCLVTSTELEGGDYRALVDGVHARDPDLPVVVVGSTVADPTLFERSGVRFVHTDGGSAVARVVAKQVESLLDRPDTDGTSLAAIPTPAFAFESGFVDYNDAFLALIDREADWLSECSLLDVLDCSPADLAAAASQNETLTVSVSGAPEPDYRLSVGQTDGRYVCLLEPVPESDRLRRAQSMLDSLLESIPLAIYFKDREGRHVAVSRHQVGMGEDGYIDNVEGKIHHVPDDVVGKTDFDLYPTQDAERYAETDQRVMENTETYVEEKQFGFTSAEDLLALRDLKAPWYDEDGDVVGVVGVTFDRTDRYLTEQRADVREEVLGTIETILRTQLSPQIPAESGDDTAQILKQTLEDVDTLLQTRRLPEVSEPTDLAAMAREAWAELDTGDATLSVETSGVVEANPTQFRTVLTELLDNAIAHGGTDVSVTVGTFDDGFYVEDDGPGIPAERRSDVTRYGVTTDDGRVGGGLTVVELLAKAHGWQTRIAEGTDGGTRVAVSGLQYH